MIFFQKNPSLKKNLFCFGRGEGKGGLASVSEFVLQRIQIQKKKKNSLFFFWGGGGWGGGRGGLVSALFYKDAKSKSFGGERGRGGARVREYFSQRIQI